MRPSTGVLILALSLGALMVRPVNAAALSIAEKSEGCELTTYLDPKGIPTAGWGHTGPDVKLGETYTMQQALSWRAADMARAAAFVEAHVKVQLTDNQFSALAEWTYNIGVGNFLGSTLLRLLNKGQYNAVPAQLARWDKAGSKVLPGLVSRRAREAALWNLPDNHPSPIAVVANVEPTARPLPPTVKVSPPSLFERIRAWFHRNAAAPVEAPT
jgi:lysozyme